MSLRSLFACLLAALPLPLVANAQVYTLATPQPAVSAADRGWFRDGEPILFTGDLYYPAGARYHFNGDVMVQTGVYDGIPLYADTSVAPYEEVLVPVGGGLVQPYVRRRAGELAGTTGSHAPDFPVEIVPWETPPPEPAPPPERMAAPGPAVPPTKAEQQAAESLLKLPGRIQTVIAPEGDRGLWLMYEGSRWVIAAEAVPFETGLYSKIGEYRGFPVFATRGSEDIYIPAADGMLAVYGKDGK